MTKRDPATYLEDMLEYAGKVGQFLEGYTEERFLADEKTIFAVIRCFEVIGEAANKIPKPLQEQYPEIPWAQIIAFRNFLIHEYLGVSMKRVWVSASTVLPETLPRLEAMLAAISQE